jgi:hypothetical protein
VAVEGEQLEEFLADAADMIQAIHPVVSLRRQSPGLETGAVEHFQAVFEEGVLFELAVYNAECLKPQPPPVVLLFKREVEPELQPPTVRPEQLEDHLERFWINILCATQQISRDDYWQALDSLQKGRNLLMACWRLGRGDQAPGRLSILDQPELEKELGPILNTTIAAAAEKAELVRALQALVKGFEDAVPAERAAEAGAVYPEDLADTAKGVMKAELAEAGGQVDAGALE